MKLSNALAMKTYEIESARYPQGTLEETIPVRFKLIVNSIKKDFPMNAELWIRIFRRVKKNGGKNCLDSKIKEIATEELLRHNNCMYADTKRKVDIANSLLGEVAYINQGILSRMFTGSAFF